MPDAAGSPGELRAALEALSQARDAVAAATSAVNRALQQLDDQPSPLLRPAEVAEQAGIGLRTVYDLMDRGDLPSVRLGRSRRVPRAAAISRARRMRCPWRSRC
jgi:excisionase family DNA binding protein